MYLIQRGHFRKEMVNNLERCDSFLSGRSTSLIDPDYMGSAEFEWGAIPASYTRIMSNFNEYQNFIGKFHVQNGFPINVFCKKDSICEINYDIRDYLKGNDPQNISTYPLKEHISLANKFYGFNPGYGINDDNFWWDIEGDFFIYIGVPDRQEAIEYVLKQDYTDWWMKLNNETKQKRIKRANNF